MGNFHRDPGSRDADDYGQIRNCDPGQEARRRQHPDAKYGNYRNAPSQHANEPAVTLRKMQRAGEASRPARLPRDRLRPRGGCFFVTKRGRVPRLRPLPGSPPAARWRRLFQRFTLIPKAKLSASGPSHPPTDGGCLCSIVIPPRISIFPYRQSSNRHLVFPRKSLR